jgi:hypothetical protein
MPYAGVPAFESLPTLFGPIDAQDLRNCNIAEPDLDFDATHVRIHSHTLTLVAHEKLSSPMETLSTRPGTAGLFDWPVDEEGEPLLEQ